MTQMFMGVSIFLLIYLLLFIYNCFKIRVPPELEVKSDLKKILIKLIIFADYDTYCNNTFRCNASGECINYKHDDSNG